MKLLDNMRPEFADLMDHHFGGVPEVQISNLRALNLCRGTQFGCVANYICDMGLTQEAPPNYKLDYLPNDYFDMAADVLSVACDIKFKEIYHEVHRVLKKGGRLFSIVPDRDCWHGPFEGVDSIQFFTPDLIRRTMNGRFKFYLGYTHILPPGEPANHIIRLWVIDAIKV